MSAPFAECVQIDGPRLLTRQRHADARGWFEVLGAPDLDPSMADLNITWQQWNISHSTEGVLRGLHYQASPHAQAKLIRVVQGEIWDVVVDLRQGSPTYGKWQSFELSAENAQCLFIPEGFAHGFLTVSAEATLIYAVNRSRCVNAEKVIRWDNPQLAIPWPVKLPILSARDASVIGTTIF